MRDVNIYYVLLRKFSANNLNNIYCLFKNYILLCFSKYSKRLILLIYILDHIYIHIDSLSEK